MRRAVADDLSAIRATAEWLESSLVDAGLSPDQRNEIQVCLEEVLANLIMYGQAPGAKDISIDVETSAEAVAIRISDACAPFDLTAIELPDTTDKTRIGGHGIRLLRAFTNTLAYRTEAGRNELSMTFNKASADERELLRRIPAFAQAEPAAFAALVAAARRLSFAPGDVMLTQDEPSAYALVLLTGEVEIFNASRHGDAVLARFGAPALVGEIGALAGLNRTASIRAVTPVTALAVERDALLAAGREAPDMLVSVIGQLGRQLVGINGALGLYAAGLNALERDDFDPAILDNLNNPTEEMRHLAAAFSGLARRVTAERRTRNEMANATLIQAAMLPPPIDPAILAGRCDAFGAMKPARHVGGDLFDLFMLDDQRLALVVGDVCGKGVPAALFMCVSVTALRIAAQRFENLEKLIDETNAALCANNAMSMFTTLFYGVLDLKTRRLNYVNCGHNPPLLLRQGGASEELPGRSPPLGMFPDRRWSSQEITLERGEGVFLYTDGVTESINPQGEDYGDARLMALLQQKRTGAEAMAQAVFADVEAFAAGADPFDDITCVAALLP